MANFMFQYVADAKEAIVRDDWGVMEKHTKAIKEYAEADSWDLSDDDVTVRYEYQTKERNWREAMFWIMENVQSLWW